MNRHDISNLKDQWRKLKWRIQYDDDFFAHIAVSTIYAVVIVFTIWFTR